MKISGILTARLRMFWFPILAFAMLAIPSVGIWELFRVDRPYAARVSRLLIVFLALMLLAVTALIIEHFTTHELSSHAAIARDRLRMAMSSGKSVGWDLDVKTGRDRWFGDLQTMFGISSDTFVGQLEDFYRNLHPEDHERVSQAISDARANRKPYQAEFRIVRPDGTVRWAAARGKFYYSKTGEPERMLGIAVDITDRKFAEAALKVSEEKFSKAFQQSPMALTLTSVKDYRFLDVNATFEQITGWRRDEVIGRTPFDLQLWVFPEQRLKIVKRLQAEGSVRDHEFQFRCRSGDIRFGLGSGEVIEVANEPCILSVVADITERKQAELALRESEGRFRRVVEHISDALIVDDVDGHVVFANDRFLRLFGLDREQLPNLRLEDYVAPGHRAELRNRHDRRMRGEAVATHFEYEGMRRDGKRMWLEVDIVPITDETGRLAGTQSAIRDVTERRRAEKLLHGSEERLRQLIDSSNDWVWEVDANGVYTYAGPQCRSILGYEPEELIGKTPFDLMPPDESLRVASTFKTIAAERKAFRALENVNIRKDGRWVVLETNGVPVIDEDGELRGYRGMDRDISERKQVELTLRESEERFRLLANTAPVMIWVAGPDKVRSYFNQQWLDFTGRPIEAELGHGWEEGIHPEDSKACLGSYQEAFDQRQSFTTQYRLRRHDGEYRWVQATGVPRFNQDNSFAGYIGACIDITDRKLAEEALATMGRRLIEAHEEERTWIARELHDDINQRLALLAIELEQWKQRVPDAAVDFGIHIEQARMHLFDISKDVQALSHRLHSSKLEYLGIATAAKSFCNELSEQHKVHIEFSHSDIPHGLPAEVSLALFRVLQEALQNAVKHSHAQDFKVELRGTPGELHLKVSDPGIGFDQMGAMGSRGLGLISMRERLQLVSGALAIESTPGHGTVIQARVPIKAESPELRRMTG